MATYTKRGVYGIDDLVPEAAEGLRVVSRLFRKKDQDLYLTSGSEGTHLMESYHYTHRAWDQRPNPKISTKMLKVALGKAFQVVDEGDHIHIQRRAT